MYICIIYLFLDFLRTGAEKNRIPKGGIRTGPWFWDLFHSGNGIPRTRPTRNFSHHSGSMNHTTFEVVGFGRGKGAVKPLVDPILAYLFDLSIYLLVAVYIVYFSPGILCHSYLCFLVCLVFAFYIFDMSKSPIYWSIYLHMCLCICQTIDWLAHLSFCLMSC